MPNNELQQNLYSPLSQNMTDSDSEEEIHSTHDHICRRMTLKNSIKMHLQRPNSHNNHTDLDDHHHMHSDNVAILNYSNEPGGNNNEATEPMGPIRKCCFIFSLIVCVLTIILFVWIIPCSDDFTCPARNEQIKTHNWMRNYEKIELKGAINVVDGLRGRSKNLVFMYRGDLWSEFEKANNPKRNGIISLIGNSGQVSWYDQIVNEPRIIDCTLLDADNNGSPDCLVVDEFGELGCINPMSGQWLWHIVDRSVRNTELLSFPLILPDLDGDAINELLVTSTNNGEQNLYHSLNIVSGANGRTLGTKFSIKECSFIHKFQLDKSQKNYKVAFNCINNDTEIQIIKPLEELYRLITNKSDLIVTMPPATIIINQHKFYGQRKDTTIQRNIYAVSGKQLIVENNGKCPDNCNVTVQLIEQKNGKDHVIRNFNGTRMYGMVPALLSFNTTSVDSKSLVHGFVIKFWEWSINETDIQFQTRHKRDTVNNNNEFNRFSNVLIKKSPWKLPTTPGDDIKLRYERSINAQNNSNKESIFKSKMRLIKETVVLIVFNSTDTRIENTSQSNIIQFCRDENNEVSCQPDLNYQENSVLIADLDQDGSQELVTYYSTFVNSGSDDVLNMDWKLITYVQLLRLEAELPKLYVVEDNKN